MLHTVAPQRAPSQPSVEWTFRASAKLNLGLRIFPARPDGFHDLETWMVPISWYDTLTVNTNTDGLQLRITGRAEGVPTDPDKNLAGRAAQKLAHAAGIDPHALLTLHKVLPAGGGLGGGSSDAAHTLVALNEAWNLHWPVARLAAIAAELGSDVPFFIESLPSLCTGRGEIMSPLPLTRTLYAVLILPTRGCPTKDVYQAFDAGHQHQPVPSRTDWPRLAAASADELDNLLINDLEPGAFAVAPWLRELRDRAAGHLRRRVHLTGSGSTLFVLCGSAPQADSIHAALRDAAAAGILGSDAPAFCAVRIGDSPRPLRSAP